MTTRTAQEWLDHIGPDPDADWHLDELDATQAGDQAAVDYYDQLRSHPLDMIAFRRQRRQAATA